jgi:hypothetical protein
MNSGLNGGWVDDLYPPNSYKTYTYDSVHGNDTNLDQCMSHTSGLGYYHYHAPSPCLGDTTLSATVPASCYKTSSCWGNYADFITSHYSKTQRPIGLANDGHIIWGPYDSTGALFNPCNLDHCNGAVIDGVYGYASTTQFPYLPGCYGPASSRDSIQPQCTMNAPTCTSKTTLLGQVQATIAEREVTTFSQVKRGGLTQRQAQ